MDSAWQAGVIALVWSVSLFLITFTIYLWTEIVTWVRVHLL